MADIDGDIYMVKMGLRGWEDACIRLIDQVGSAKQDLKLFNVLVEKCELFRGVENVRRLLAQFTAVVGMKDLRVREAYFKVLKVTFKNLSLEERVECVIYFVQLLDFATTSAKVLGFESVRTQCWNSLTENASPEAFAGDLAWLTLFEPKMTLWRCFETVANVPPLSGVVAAALARLAPFLRVRSGDCSLAIAGMRKMCEKLWEDAGRPERAEAFGKFAVMLNKNGAVDSAEFLRVCAIAHLQKAMTKLSDTGPLLAADVHKSIQLACGALSLCTETLRDCFTSIRFRSEDDYSRAAMAVVFDMWENGDARNGVDAAGQPPTTAAGTPVKNGAKEGLDPLDRAALISLLVDTFRVSIDRALFDSVGTFVYQLQEAVLAAADGLFSAMRAANAKIGPLEWAVVAKTLVAVQKGGAWAVAFSFHRFASQVFTEAVSKNSTDVYQIPACIAKAFQIDRPDISTFACPPHSENALTCCIAHVVSLAVAHDTPATFLIGAAASTPFDSGEKRDEATACLEKALAKYLPTFGIASWNNTIRIVAALIRKRVISVDESVLTNVAVDDAATGKAGGARAETLSGEISALLVVGRSLVKQIGNDDPVALIACSHLVRTMCMVSNERINTIQKCLAGGDKKRVVAAADLAPLFRALFGVALRVCEACGLSTTQAAANVLSASEVSMLFQLVFNVAVIEEAVAGLPKDGESVGTTEDAAFSAADELQAMLDDVATTLPEAAFIRTKIIERVKRRLEKERGVAKEN